MFTRLLVGVCVLFPALAGAQDWNQWRGPNRDGYVPASPALLNALPEEGISPLWMSEDAVPAGGSGGWSSPVVADSRLFLFAHTKERREGVELPPEKFPKLDDAAREKLSDEDREQYEAARREEQDHRRDLQYRHDDALICFDAKTGEQLWVNKSESKRTRYPQSASPAVLDGVAFVHGARGNVRAVDAVKGETRWSTQLPGEFDEEPHPASVAATDGTVVIVANRVFALDAKSGTLKWKSEDEFKGNGSSPAIWQHGDQSFVIAHVGKETVCWNIDNGEEHWRAEAYAGRSSPLVKGDKLITYGNSRKGGVRCFQMTLNSTELLWTNTSAADEGSSPVVIGDHVYVHAERKLYCIDLAKGKTQWRRELDIDRPRYTSLIAADDKVIFAAGGLLCFSAQPEKYDLLVDGRINKEGRVAPAEYFRKQLKIDELERTAEGQKQAESLWRKEIDSSGPAQCVSPAMADGKLFLRLRNNRLACYDLRVR